MAKSAREALWPSRIVHPLTVRVRLIFLPHARFLFGLRWAGKPFHRTDICLTSTPHPHLPLRFGSRVLWSCSKAALEPKNKDGKTAQDVAELNEQKDIIELLTKHTKDAESGNA